MLEREWKGGFCFGKPHHKETRPTMVSKRDEVAEGAWAAIAPNRASRLGLLPESSWWQAGVKTGGWRPEGDSEWRGGALSGRRQQGRWAALSHRRERREEGDGE